MPTVSRTRLYWICQLGGWAFGMGAFIGLAALTGGIENGVSEAEIAYASAASYVLSVAATHGIHVVARRRG